MSSSVVNSSSSAVIHSSSSVVRSSSSWSGGKSGTIEYITDSRDGQTYKTVVIGTQTWMAQNLNYETDNSYCYKDSSKYCEKFGRLYTWAAAMDSVGSWSTNGMGCGYFKTCKPTYPVRGVCPTGWHLPTQPEWDTLFTAVGGKSVAGTKLKSTSGWNDYDGKNGNGTDDNLFSALPVGYRGYNGKYYDEGNNAYFWSSAENDIYLANDMDLECYGDRANLDNFYKGNGYSVRCVKDD